MIKFHPDSTLLVDFSSGSLDKAPAISVSAHLSFCSECRSKVNKLNAVGAELMDAEKQSVSSDLFSKVMAKVHAQSTERDDKLASPDIEDTISSEFAGFPVLVKKLIADTPKSRWKKISKSLDVARLKAGQNDYEVALHRIHRGGQAPLHGHTGDEFTVVMRGSFSDEHGLYQPGDFIFRSADHEHQPMGVQHEDCICLSVLQAPIRLKHPLGILMKPWLRIRPM